MHYVMYIVINGMQNNFFRAVVFTICTFLFSFYHGDVKKKYGSLILPAMG